MSKKLTDKVAVVTGASKGIGAEIARQLAGDGATVVVNYSSSEDAANAVVAQITETGGRAVAIQADVSKEADVLKLFADTRKAFGRVDILVNNAGVYEFGAIEEMTEAQYRRLFGLNVLGVLLTTREAAKQFAAEGGNVINISSVAASAAPPTGSIYSATKAAVDAITMSLAKELGPKGIRVNSVSPGMVETEGAHSLGIIDSDWAKQVATQTPLGRLGKPNDIAPVVSFIASDEARWITGQVIHVSGGDR
ncbi:3-oxoacyl-[acyl-carrier-protein] reductase FabG [Stieleria neptunia]|uniref:3-oxoacyl-[acyl-carrier-protein] reductase FabG n=1 Tax=Stieleria neptunia TaxID=2527979 RepID=A0A518HY97_9BACT|nr:glucose 1-dehydrogenase [Stieleria neptunia]QDV45831.1 3-oxoacyl-[acyl-carrier-protein] reductase FabG [Stieleria neptunia]